jgi:hypothetical protein
MEKVVVTGTVIVTVIVRIVLVVIVVPVFFIVTASGKAFQCGNVVFSAAAPAESK